MKKLKTYVLTVSRTFPAYHPRKGEPTFFKDQIILDKAFGNGKIHTIRGNCPLWEERIKKVQEGKAVLSLRYWAGKPYNSKQIEFATLDKDSGVGVQELRFAYNTDSEDHDHEGRDLNQPFVCPRHENELYRDIDMSELAKNDGLHSPDFRGWFKPYDLSNPLAIIHFTDFRY